MKNKPALQFLAILAIMCGFMGFYLLGRHIGPSYYTISGNYEQDSSEETGNRTVAFLELNHATASELAQIPGLSTDIAKSIVDYRKKYGDFLSVKELKYVDGISRELFDGIEKYLYVQ